MLRLQVKSGQAEGHSTETREDPIRIGRSDDNELVVDGWHVSGVHASTTLTDFGFLLRDHHSTNGTRFGAGKARTSST